MGQENQTQKTIGSTQLPGKPDPETIYGQRPYMGFNTVGQENQTQKTIGFNTVGRKTRPRDLIWAKTIYGIQHSGTGKSDPKDDRIQHSWQENQTQRPYMGKDHIWDSTQWDRKIRPKKTLGFNTVGRKTRPKYHIWTNTIYGQRPYMGFNTVGQENQTQKDVRIQHSWQGNQTQRPYMGKDHIWDSTQWDRETRPKNHRIQHIWDRETIPKDHIWAKTIYGIQHSGTGKSTQFGQGISQPSAPPTFRLESYIWSLGPVSIPYMVFGSGFPVPTVLNLIYGLWVRFPCPNCAS